MPQYIKAYIVLLFLGSLSFFIIKPLYNSINNSVSITNLYKVWLIITTALFFSHNIWIFFTIVAIICLNVAKQVPIRIAWFFFLILIAPQSSVYVSGVAGIQSLISLNQTSILSIFLLFPCLKYIKLDPDRALFPSLFTDKVLILFCLYFAAHSYREFASITVTLKECIEILLIFVLPYYTLTRGLKTPLDFTRLFSTILVAGLIISIVSTFEFLKHWLLYSEINDLLSVAQEGAEYKGRGGYVRARAIFNNPITNGYILVYIICGWYIANETYQEKSRKISSISLLLILTGLYATSSRGPWLGALLFYLITITLFNKRTLKSFKKLFIMGTAFFLLFLVTGQLDRFVKLLPFIGEGGIDSYRSKLIENSLIVIQRNILFGSTNKDFLGTPEMIEMIQGEGIIDVTNTYLAILLNDGVIGLTIYLSLLLYPTLKIYQLLKKRNFQYEYIVIGRSLIAMVISHLLIIGTVSSIGNIYNFTWLLVGLTVSFSNILKKDSKNI